MEPATTRSTFYLEPPLHQALRLKAASTRRSMSEIVNDALRNALREDEQDHKSRKNLGLHNGVSGFSTQRLDAGPAITT
jgi:hypothetical protein